MSQARQRVRIRLDGCAGIGGDRGGLPQHIVLAAEILGGQRVGIRLDDKTLSFFDLDTRQLLRIACDDGTRTVRRTTDQPVRNLKASRPRKVTMT